MVREEKGGFRGVFGGIAGGWHVGFVCSGGLICDDELTV